MSQITSVSDRIEEYLDALNDNDSQHFFTPVAGRKYVKIVCTYFGSRSVHAFVDKKTGDVYKPASWNAPAKHVRYNLMNEQSRNECFRLCDPYGGYLYLR